MLYDSFLLVAVYFVATAFVLPLAGGKAVASGNILYSLYLLGITCAYFIWQWKKGRQTLGMRAWHVFLVRDDGAPLDWKVLLQRFFLAMLSLLTFGAGFFHAILNKL